MSKKMKKLETNKVYVGSCLDVLKTFPDESLDMCVTSPPYWGLRDYGTEGHRFGVVMKNVSTSVDVYTKI